MTLNEDVNNANKMLIEELNKSSDENTWSLLHTPLYCRLYYLLSNKHGKYPGRMSKESEKLLLETLWDITVSKNGVFLANR